MTTVTTRADRAAISAAKLQKDISNCNEFLIRIVGPMYANIAQGGYSEKIQCSARHVQDTYGAKAKDCFELMFKLVNRGGITRPNEKNQRVKYSSNWVPNQEAIQPYIDWAQSIPREERTCSSLLKALKEAEVIQLQWTRQTRTWVSKEARDELMKHKRQQDNQARPANISAEELEEISAINW